MFGYVSKEAKVNAGLTILESGQPVGITKSSCWSPTLESGVGYVVFDQGLSNGETWVGKTLTIEDAAGDEHDCEIVTLPFFDKEKKIPRGLSPEMG